MQSLNQMDIDWAVERLPKNVYRILKSSGSGLVLAGGYIRSIIAHEEVNDIDLFPANPVMALKLARGYAALNSTEMFTSENAYSVKDQDGIQVQFIHRWSYTDPFKLIESFDFTIGQAAIWIPVGQEAKGICADSYYQDLAAKRLVYTNPTREESAGGSLLRMLKFGARGYRVPLDSLADMIARLSEAAAIYVNTGSSKTQTLSANILNLLHEVDPHTDPSKRAYTPIKALHENGTVPAQDANSGYEVFGWQPPSDGIAPEVVQ